MVSVYSDSYNRELDPSEFSFDGDLLTLPFPGDFNANFYFAENEYATDYFPHVFNVPVCPVTYFIENDPTPVYQNLRDPNIYDPSLPALT